MSNNKEIRARLAPSPSGRMHAGNIFSALISWLVAKCQDGKVVLRIEDLDRERSKREYTDQILKDFEALGLIWDEGPFFQSERTSLYEEAFRKLEDFTYPCFCTRAELHSQSAPHTGEYSIYSGKCKELSKNEIDHLMQLRLNEGRGAAIRLNVPDLDISVEDLFCEQFTQNLKREVGDFVIKRSDGGFAYQLAVVVDDGLMGINSVIRGSDLLSSTPQQLYLCKLLDLPKPTFGHVPLICASDGRRLAKRNKDAMLDELLVRYKTPKHVLGHIAYIAGLLDEDMPITPQDLLQLHNIESLRKALYNKTSITYK